MTTDFRALCAELVETFKDENTYTQRVEILDRARAALATPPPLSPAASAVWKAFQELYSYPEDIDEYNVGAAIRAAADQLDHADSAHILFAIADELEAQ